MTKSMISQMDEKLGSGAAALEIAVSLTLAGKSDEDFDIIVTVKAASDQGPRNRQQLLFRSRQASVTLTP